MSNSVLAARALLLAGADVNAVTMQLRTPLHVAVKFGSISVVRLLVQWGAEVNSRDGNGKRPRDVAVEMGHVGMLGLLAWEHVDGSGGDI